MRQRELFVGLFVGSTPAPAMPTGMVVAPGNNEVTVTWNTVAGVTSYNIYRSTSQGQQGTKVGASSTLSYVDSTALNGVTYYYEVTAANAAGEGPVSAQSTGVTPAMPITVPAPPTGVNAVAGNGQVTVTWTAATGSTSYNIYRSTSQGSQGTKIGASSTASYTDTTVVNGTTYYYEVTAANAAGESPTSTQSAPATPGGPAAALAKRLGRPNRFLVGLGGAGSDTTLINTQGLKPDFYERYLVGIDSQERMDDLELAFGGLRDHRDVASRFGRRGAHVHAVPVLISGQTDLQIGLGDLYAVLLVRSHYFAHPDQPVRQAGAD